MELKTIKDKTPELIKKTAFLRFLSLNKTIPENKHIADVVHHANTPIFDIIPVNGCTFEVNTGSPTICMKGISNLIPVK
ncbi:hypothetical protein VOI54_13215 [Tamlana sp. 2201CG12-4]|uniref:hypothetical protein n=1 Tax=Tamlana sp. 2201CG12-4 TaxID=3112582 RepID=UPI002DC05516|nr:hypothetical protein [Tamlana sp. 2201CG12-4]MEC3907984.1 hypothetical protein [Tamlana sp. 2201CG12-4]